MEAQIVIYSLALSFASGLLFGISRMVDSLEERLREKRDSLSKQHAKRRTSNTTDIFNLFEQLMYLEKRKSGVEWMERLLGWGYVTGYLLGISGFIVLLLYGNFNWSESTIQTLTSVISYLALASVVGNAFIAIGVFQTCRRRKREATIVT